MARVGYARVSSVGQSLAVQFDKLTACDKIYQEKKSGSASRRPSLEACLEYVREGDTLVVTRLDRLARSTLHLCQIAEYSGEGKLAHRHFWRKDLSGDAYRQISVSICFGQEHVARRLSRLRARRRDC